MCERGVGWVRYVCVWVRCVWVSGGSLLTDLSGRSSRIYTLSTMHSPKRCLWSG